MVEQETTTNPTKNSADDHAEQEQVNYFERVGIDQTFLRVFRIVFGSKNWPCFFIISFLAVGLRYLLTYISDYVNGPDIDVDYSMDDSVQDLVEVSAFDSAATSTMYLVDSIIFFVVMCLNDGAIIQAVAEMYVGCTPTAVASIGTAAYKLVPLVGSSLLVGLILFIPLFILMLINMGLMMNNGTNGIILTVLVMIVIGIYVAVITFNMYPAIVVENTSATRSIWRSSMLAEGHFGEILAVVIIFGLFQNLLSFAVGIWTLSENGATRIVGNILLFVLAVVFASLRAV